MSYIFSDSSDSDSEDDGRTTAGASSTTTRHVSSSSSAYNDDITSNALTNEENEIWPPHNYDPLEPLSLPFGPRTQTARAQLTNMVILSLLFSSYFPPSFST